MEEQKIEAVQVENPEIQAENPAPAAEEPIATPPAKKHFPIKAIIIGIAALLVVAIAVVLVLVFGKGGRYSKALKLIEDGKYKEAYEILEELGDYKDSKELLSRFRYVPVKSEFANSEEDYTVTLKATLNKKNLPSKITYIDGEEENTIKFTYDSKGRLTLEEFFTGDDYWYKHEYSYDSDGNVIEIKISDDDGFLGGIWKIIYDSKGNKIKEEYETSYGERRITEYTYDSKGNLILEEREYSNDDWDRIEYTYDSKGNLIKIEFESDFQSSTTEYTYDSKGNLIKEESESDGGYRNVTEYIYDSKGNLIEEVSEGDYYINRYEYTYDSYGNMIEKKDFRGYDSNAVLLWYSQEIENKFVYIPFEWNEGYEYVFGRIIEEGY